MIDIAAIKARFEALAPVLNERGRRLFAASEAHAAGHGGVVAVSRATGIARSTIGRGLADLGSDAVRWSPEFGQRVKLGLLLRRTDRNDEQTETVFSGLQGEGCA
jgi:hypothetical protein